MFSVPKTMELPIRNDVFATDGAWREFKASLARNRCGRIALVSAHSLAQFTELCKLLRVSNMGVDFKHAIIIFFVFVLTAAQYVCLVSVHIFFVCATSWFLLGSVGSIACQTQILDAFVVSQQRRAAARHHCSVAGTAGYHQFANGERSLGAGVVTANDSERRNCRKTVCRRRSSMHQTAGSGC